MRLLVAGFMVATGIASASFLAYTDPTGAGNQAFGGALGMDFNVVSAIQVIALGAFDSGQDGLANPIRVQIFNRSTGLVFGGLDLSISGLSGSITGGDRVVNLASAVILPAGFQGSVVASGFSASDLNGNSNPGGSSGGSFSATNTGGGLISFVGTSRYGFTPGAFPTNPDGNVAKYGAGTFLFNASPIAIPEPESVALVGIGLAASLLYRGLRRRRAHRQV